ncbi:hypothetical protein WMY93_032258 [Mugilogobius chulae]|uniref:Integrin beta subunit tail domain-containing protein n=1 Tax=Mugilogobius chulae TaxID=88201 RepID=A0AAW0MD19_9GOBI
MEHTETFKNKKKDAIKISSSSVWTGLVSVSHRVPCVSVPRRCVECLGFNLGPFQQNCSLACSNVSHQVVARLDSSRHCELKDSEGCWLRFKLQQLVGKDSYSATILEQRGQTKMNRRKQAGHEPVGAVASETSRVESLSGGRERGRSTHRHI